MTYNLQSPTYFINTGTTLISSNTLSIGSTYFIKINTKHFNKASTNGSQWGKLQLYLNSTKIEDFLAVNLVGSDDTFYEFYDVVLTFRSIGNSGVVTVSSNVSRDQGAVATTPLNYVFSTNTTINTTIDQSLRLNYITGTGGTGNYITLKNLILEKIN
jgi:hypothetical protein